jgi:SRSO17 transposase
MHTEKTLLLEVLEWKKGLEELHARIGRHFKRAEPREHVLAYLKGLLGPVERKNGWQIAEWLADPTPDRVQRLLASAKWDVDRVRDDLQAYVRDTLCDPQAVFALDDTGFAKQGKHSVGVQRQYNPSTKQVENCQISVFLSYVSERGSTFLDRELYLPAEWVADQQRCRQAAIPAHVGFATKPQLAQRMIARARSAGLPFTWVAADSTYGSDPELRTWLESEQIPFVLAVRSNEPIGVITEQGIRQMAAADAVGLVGNADWHRMSMGEGTKGPRVFDWARFPIESGGKNDQRHWLLIRRSLLDESDLSFYVVFGPVGTTLEQMVRVVGARWKIEEIFEAAKGEVGLDQYEVRLWTSWYRHITLVMLAHAYLTVMRAHGISREGSTSQAAAVALLPLTVPEVRHVLWQVLWSRPPPLRSVVAWSLFRRCRQERARQAHRKHRALCHANKPPVDCPGFHRRKERMSERPPNKTRSERRGKPCTRVTAVIYWVTDQEYLLSEEQGTCSFPAQGSRDWFATIERLPSFRFCGHAGRFSVRKEHYSGGRVYWGAYRRYHHKQYHLYLGRTAQLSPARLEQAAAKLQRQIASAETTGSQV